MTHACNSAGMFISRPRQVILIPYRMPIKALKTETKIASQPTALAPNKADNADLAFIVLMGTVCGIILLVWIMEDL